MKFIKMIDDPSVKEIKDGMHLYGMDELNKLQYALSFFQPHLFSYDNAPLNFPGQLKQYTSMTNYLAVFISFIHLFIYLLSLQRLPTIQYLQNTNQYFHGLFSTCSSTVQ